MTAAWITAPPAAACMLPAPQPHETFEQYFVRIEGPAQRRLFDRVDAVYLAYADYREMDRGSDFTPIVRMKGSFAPRKLFEPDAIDTCGPIEARGVVIVFAHRTRPSDNPWKPWEWGRWSIIDWRYPRGVVDRSLAISIRKAAEKMRASGR